MNYTGEKVSLLKDNSSVSIYKQLAYSIGQLSLLSLSLCPFENVTRGQLAESEESQNTNPKCHFNCLKTIVKALI